MDKYDLICQKGADFRRVMRLKKNGEYLDLTGWSGKSQVRVEPDGGEMVCEIAVTVDDSENKIILSIEEEITAALSVGCFAWDIKLTDADGITKYYVGGKFNVVPSVTE